MGPHHKPFGSARPARDPHALDLVGALYALWRAARWALHGYGARHTRIVSYHNATLGPLWRAGRRARERGSCQIHSVVARLNPRRRSWFVMCAHVVNSSPAEAKLSYLHPLKLVFAVSGPCTHMHMTCTCCTCTCACACTCTYGSVPEARARRLACVRGCIAVNRRVVFVWFGL